MNPQTLLLAAIALPAYAIASPAQGAAEQALPAITVTGKLATDIERASSLATGVETPALDTPFSATTVPAALVREQAGTTLQDALRNVPGAQADSGFNGAHTQFFILRGAVADSGTGSSRVLRDGARLSNYPYVPAFVESVDVLRGPGAAASVRSEPGGTVNIGTRKPRLSNASSVSAGAGSGGARDLSVDINRVLSQDEELAARIIATRSRGSEWRHVPDALDGVKLGIAKSDGARYRLRAGFEATNQAYQPDFGVPALNGRPVDVPRDRQLGEAFGDSTTRNRIVDLHGDAAVGASARLTVDATHLEASATAIKNALTGSPLAGQPAGTYARVSSWEPDTTRRIDSLATSLAGRWTTATTSHQLYLALDYYRETLDQPGLAVPPATSPNINVYAPQYGLVTAPPAGLALRRTVTTQDLRAAGASLQDQVDFDAWSVVAGVRYQRQQFLYGTTGVLPVDESRWSPKLAVLYRMSEADSVYANVATGTSPNQVASSSNQSLPSRRSAQAELGWKSLWRDGRLVSGLAAYRLEQSNMISSDLGTPLNNFDFTTAGSAVSQGIEASLTGDIGKRSNIAASYAYTAASYRRNAVYAGRQVPNVARHVLNLWGQYRWDGAWKTGAGVYGQGRRFADEANTTVLPGHARVDLVQGWTRKLTGGQSLDVQLALRNALDAHYYVSSHLHVSRWIMPGQGRNVALSATWRM